MTKEQILNTDLRTLNQDQLNEVVESLRQMPEDEMLSVVQNIYDDERYSSIDEKNSDFSDPDKIEFKYEDCFIHVIGEITKTHEKVLDAFFDPEDSK